MYKGIHRRSSVLHDHSSVLAQDGGHVFWLSHVCNKNFIVSNLLRLFLFNHAVSMFGLRHPSVYTVSCSRRCVVCTYLCLVLMVETLTHNVLSEELRKIEYMTECNSGKIIGTRPRSGGMMTTTKTFTRLHRCLVLEGTAIVSMTLNVEERVEIKSCLDECLSALEEELLPLRLGSLLEPINDGLV